MKRLLPQDYQFIEMIQKEISEYSAIPLEIKPDRIKTIISDSAKFFYEKHPQAIERRHFLIKKSEIDASRKDGVNAIYKLPDSIKFIFRTRRSVGGSVLGSATYLNSPLMGLGRFNSGIGVGVGSLGGLSSDLTSVTLSLYEFQAHKSISPNNRGISHSWSELTHQITFLSDVDNDVVLECGVQIPIVELYNDLWFKMYVQGKCLQALGRIVGTYDHRYVGGVTINWNDWKEDGKEMVEKVEEELATYNTNNFIITR